MVQRRVAFPASFPVVAAGEVTGMNERPSSLEVSVYSSLPRVCLHHSPGVASVMSVVSCGIAQKDQGLKRKEHRS